MSCKNVKLGDVCKIKYGKDHKKLGDGNMPVYGSGGIMRHADKALHTKPSVLIPRKGTLGNLFFVDEPFWTVDTLFWTDIDEHMILPRFLYYQLRTKNIADLNVGTAVPSLTTDVLNEIEITVPPLKSQIVITSQLATLDEKISINQRINGYLAELAQALFQEMFDDARTTPLHEYLSISTKSLKPQESKGEMWEHYSIPAYDETRRPVFELADGIKSNKYVVDDNCILISKLNPSIKRIWMPECYTDKAVCSTEFIVYKANNPSQKSFCYSAIDDPRFTDYLLAHVTGSTGSRQRAQPKETLNYPFPHASAEEIAEYCKLADPLYAAIHINERESFELEQLRDSLLPKLMSGEIDVSQIELRC